MPQRVAACRDIIDRQTSHLGRLVDDLLDMGRITTGKIDLRMARVDVSDIVARSIELVHPFTDERAQRVVTKLPQTPVYVMGDSTRLVQVVQNLLNNASKFSPRASTIMRRSRVRGDARCLLKVIDTGRGISQKGLTSIFDLFVQEDHYLESRRGGARHRAHAVPVDRRDAWRLDQRGERRAESGQHVHGAPALCVRRRCAAAASRARAECDAGRGRRSAHRRDRRQPRFRRQPRNAAADEGA